MAKNQDLLYVVNGKRYFVQDLSGGGSEFVYLAVIGVLFWLYSQMTLTFHMPNDTDFTSELYRDTAKEVAVQHVLFQDRLAWIQKNFVTESHTPKSFNIDEGFGTKNKSSVEMTKYLRQGQYQVYVSSIVTLATTSNDKSVTQSVLDINNEYIVTIKASPHRHWYGTVEFKLDGGKCTLSKELTTTKRNRAYP
ncbi:hypothetical protein [Pelosinus sp. sgz500959]|uniref:hypothetical protein n=1 Tax=Pelosinus sp. sgz500959 TaxID=3242472 RepID=UPI0036711CDB